MSAQQQDQTQTKSDNDPSEKADDAVEDADFEVVDDK